MAFKHEHSGFTLLEIMVAVSILAFSLLTILNFHSDSMLASLQAEEITTASMLARQKLLELQLDIEKDMSKGEFPGEDKEMEGGFDEPFERYKWVANIKKVEIPIPGSAGGGDEAGGAGTDVMFQAFKMVAEKIGESAREIRLEVKWEELGVERSISVATHIVKL